MIWVGAREEINSLHGNTVSRTLSRTYYYWISIFAHHMTNQLNKQNTPNETVQYAMIFTLVAVVTCL